MSQAEQDRLLKAELEAVLKSAGNSVGVCQLLRESVDSAARRRAGERPWQLLPLIACQAICGQYEQALPAAAALFLLRVAAGIFDDIEDADSDESVSTRYGPAVATNAGTALVLLAQRAVARLRLRGVEDKAIVGISEVITSHHMIACFGQHLDLLPSEEFASEHTYLRIAGMKSAASVVCACHVGALLAGASKNVIGALTSFGYNIGMASQIANDIGGAMRGGDIAKRRMTLPVIYALGHAAGAEHEMLAQVFGSQRATADRAQILGLLFRNGAIHYAVLKVEYYKQRASEALARVGETPIDSEGLRLFLE